MIVHKCSRCGKDIKVEKSKDLMEIKCAHCNKEYEISKKTKRNAMFLVTFFVFIIAFISTTISEVFDFSVYYLMAPVIFVSIFLYRFVLFILAKNNK